MSDPKGLALHKRKGSWVGTVKAVLWAFLGVRRHADYQADVKNLNPLHIAAVGIAATFVFVVGLMLLGGVGLLQPPDAAVDEHICLT
jgi:Protein of unknown function (DUF2970).